jgi:hypothetical protein
MRRTFRTLMLVAMMAVSALGAPLCIPGTLEDYVGLGDTGCQIDDKLFYNFTYAGTGSGGAAAIPDEGVAVVVFDTPLNPGLQFSAAWSVGPGQTLDSLIQYNVVVLPGGFPIGDISARMAGFGVDQNGVVAVAEVVSTLDVPPEVLANLLLFRNGGTVAFQRVDIAPTLGPLHVVKDISVNGNDGFATVSMVTNRFSEVPEPGALLLIGSGLLGLGLFTRRFRNN